MKGLETLWQPGTDHAGIATQDIEEKNRRELENRSYDQRNAKDWYDSYLKKCQSQKQHVHFEKNYSDDDEYFYISDSNSDPEDNFDWETYGIELQTYSIVLTV